MANQTPLDLPVPEDRMARIHTLAYDLAYGVIYKLWENYFRRYDDTLTARLRPDADKLNIYFLQKWWTSKEENAENYIGIPDIASVARFMDIPSVDLLVTFQYLEEENGNYYRLTEKAFMLLERTPPSSIFISYNRSQSGAFALLVLTVLQRVGLNPFLDIRDIALGDEWHGLIKDEVKRREVFICLIGPNTLASPYVQREIGWATEDKEKKRIISIFHSGLNPENLKGGEFEDLLKLNYIRVKDDETAIDYQNALDQLLNYFGRTLQR